MGSTFIANLDYGFTIFDNFALSMWLVFQCITLEGWSSIMYKVQRLLSCV